MSELSKMIPIQIRNESLESTMRTPERGTSVGVRGLYGDGLPSKDNESPVNSVNNDSNSVIIKIHESYDICNDDINEDYAVSYENEYFHNSKLMPENTNTLSFGNKQPPGTPSGVLANHSNPSSPSFCVANASLTPHSGLVANDTQKMQRSFLEKVNNELEQVLPAQQKEQTNDFVRTPERGVSEAESVGVRGLSGDGLTSKDKVDSPDMGYYSRLMHPFSRVLAQEYNRAEKDAGNVDMTFWNEGNYIKTDSMLFHQSIPTITEDGLITFEDKSSPVIPRTPSKNNAVNGVNTRSKLINAFLMTNSPLSSHTNSDTELSDNEQSGPNTNSRYLIQEHVENAISNRKMHFKKISYEEIERSLSKYYDKNNKYSNEVDILITFIRGQKHLYNQSCYITQIKLYALTITALSITSLITVVTPFIQQYWWKIIFVMSGNAITTVLITILKYMRFESACNTFTLLSNHYEHYEHSLQITSNKLVFIQDEKEQTKIVLDKMQEIEFKMRETKELCPIIIPVEVQNAYPVIYQTNIFTLIKKMDMHRKTLIMKLKNIKNEIRYILYKWNTLSGAGQLGDEDNTQIHREKIRLLDLMDQKEIIKKELIEYKDNYTQIDDLFMKEIKYAEINKKCWKWFWCNTQKIHYENYTNHVIKEHLELILSQ
jgi:hypothetical protein